MKEIYIVNYCNPNCSPLNSITRLSEADAYEKASDLSAKYCGTSFYRFKDFKDYYPRRLRTEKWLYDWVTNHGGEPDVKHPLYFVLSGSDYLAEWFDRAIITRLPISMISSKHVSFTFGDSMAKFDKPERKDPFLKETLLEHIEHYNSNVRLFLDSIKDRYTYIEAQLWSDIYIHR